MYANVVCALLRENGELEMLMRCWISFHKPKLPMAKAAFVGAAGTSASAAGMVLATPLESSRPRPLALFLPPALGLLFFASFTFSSPKSGFAH
jgi:hypothetical protein